MAPIQPESSSKQATAPAGNNEQRQQSSASSPGSEMEEISLQPVVPKPMNPEAPHEEPQMDLRGGDRGGMCPGRFCFCVPCPLPCDFCII